jgi:flagellar biosynthesis protein FlhF
MQVKRFVADDMRSVMRIVKDEMGAEAVILSNRVVDGKIEILAARDYDETLINNALDKSLVESKPDSAAAYYERAGAERELQQQYLSEKVETSAVEDQESKTLSAEQLRHKENDLQKDQQIESFVDGVQSEQLESSSLQDSVETKPAQDLEQLVKEQIMAQMQQQSEHQAAGLVQAQQAPLTDSMTQMRDELKSLRAMIENQQVLGEWSEMASKHPLRVSLYKRLTEMGLSQEICKYLAKGLDKLTDVEQAMEAALKQLVHQLPIAGDDILNQGGVYAMVGPTGVGKTTTIAKLAARFAMQHGQRHVALISTDTYRIGAHEQLMTYGRLLGVPVHSANDTQELQQLLHKLHDKKLVLIDTAGMSQRDIGLSQQFAHLKHVSSGIKPYLVLSANAQVSTLDEVMTAFQSVNPAGCIITKLDEAASLGGILSAVVKQKLAVAYVSNGQKVPEDIQPARAQELVNMMIEYSKRHTLHVDDEFLATDFNSSMADLRL